jgi:hypothetical protein
MQLQVEWTATKSRRKRFDGNPDEDQANVYFDINLEEDVFRDE